VSHPSHANEVNLSSRFYLQVLLFLFKKITLHEASSSTRISLAAIPSLIGFVLIITSHFSLYVQEHLQSNRLALGVSLVANAVHLCPRASNAASWKTSTTSLRHRGARNSKSLNT